MATTPSPDDPEAVLVAGALISPALAVEATKLVGPDDFADQRLGTVWKAITELLAAGMPTEQIDTLSVAARCAVSPKAQRQVAAFASRLLDGFPRYSSLVNAALRVHRRATMRVALEGMRSLATPLKDSLASPGGDIDDLEARLAQLSVEVSARRDGPNMRTVYRDLAHDVTAYFDQLAAGPLADSIPTGISALDKRLGGGLRPWQLHTIAGVTGFGKTALASQIADHAATHGHRTLMFSMEIDPVDVYIRDVEREAQRSRWDLRSPFLAQREGAQVDLVAAQSRLLARASGKVVYGEPVSVETIRQTVLTEQLRGGPVRLVVVDHAQVAKATDNERKQMPRYLEVKAVAVGLRLLARKLGVAVVLTAQMNPPPKGEAPTMFFIRESKDIVNSSDVVLLIWHEREEVGDETAFQRSWLIMDKIRAGATGKIPVRYKGETFTFEDLVEPHHTWQEGQ